MTPLTEDEARQKWCPFARVQEQGAVTAGDLASNRGTRDPNPLYARCIASDCMAWREVHKATSREDHSGARDVMNTEALRTGRSVRREGPSGCLGILILDAVGFCGMAGSDVR